MAKRRGHGDGSLFYDQGRRRYVGMIDLGRDERGRRRRVKVSARTRAEALAKLREAQRASDGGMRQPDRRTTVAELAAEWRQRGLPASTADNTRDTYRRLIETHVLPALGHRRVVDLDVSHVEGMLDAMAAAGKAHDTMARVRALTSRILSFGVKRGRVTRDVAALANVPAGPKAERRSLTADEARRLLDAATGDRLEALYRTGLMLGLRPGELLGLTWQTVDLDAGVLTVAQALRQRPGGEPVLVEPKTRRSVRRLDLPPVLVDALRAHRKRQAAERLAAGALWADLGLVFTTEVGRPIDPSNLRRAMRRLGLAAGVGHVHPHLLRHCTASLLSAAGVPLEDVADVLGHASPSVTGAIYRHPVRPTVSAGRDVMQGMFGAGAAQ